MTDFIAAYRDYLTEEKHASANTLSSYIRDLTQFHSWLLSVGVTDMRKVKKETINEYLLHMTHSGKSPATVTRSTASIKSFYAYMMQCGAVKSNPAKSVVAMKVERKYPEILTNREVELFLEQPKCVDEKGFRDHAMLELLYATGIRVSELIGLDVSDVNLSAGFIRCRSKGKERIVPLYTAAVKALEDYVRDIRPRLIADEEEHALFVNMTHESPGLLEDHQVLSGKSGHREGYHPPHPAPFLCRTPAGKRRRSEVHSGDAGSRGYQLHADIYTRYQKAAEGCI